MEHLQQAADEHEAGGDETSADLVDARKADEDRKANHVALVAAKKEIASYDACATTPVHVC